MNNEEIDQLFEQENRQINKLHEIVHKTRKDEQLIVLFW